MARDDRLSRRRMVQLTGVAASTAFVAGCGGGGGGDGGDGGDGGGGGGGGVEIEPGTEIDFSGQTSHWEGLAPSEIEGEQNPTLILQEGEDYTIGWSEGDDSDHNLEIRDDSDQVIDDLTTGDPVSNPDEAENNPFDFTASSEMATYRCEPHPNMEGEIQVEGGGGGGGGGGEEGDNESEGGGGNESEDGGGNESEDGGGNESEDGGGGGEGGNESEE